MKKIVAICVMLGVTVLKVAAQTASTPVNLTDLKFTVEAAPDWNALLKRQQGWFGGDGIYTIPLNGVENKQAKADDKILFIFSDSMIGKIENGTMAPGYKMLHNSMAWLKGNQPADAQMKFYWDTDKKRTTRKNKCHRRGSKCLILNYCPYSFKPQ